MRISQDFPRDRRYQVEVRFHFTQACALSCALCLSCRRFLHLRFILLRASLIQVEGTVHVSWVQPRVLGIPQIKSLRDRLDNWVDKVHTALLSVEAETPDLVAS
ncbi:26S proteasome non-ATPase regulatory subunit 13-like B [Vitis vinifera]|uniref:26S proteasome non-ATPase regulatory subunit 13-like B n=1 Tax=Vitis vinifera TaxID=29760 RepID=A0A438H836_VITVI|nr:26S proteasome non-ATPase regulatory subunit 13-like B [Vitis vinifera]